MTELYIDGTPAYLPQDLAVQVKRENPLFTKNGEYTYDITLPLSAPANAGLYSHLNRLNSVTEVKTKRRAVLVADNRVYCNGTEVVTGWTDDTVSIQIASGNSELNYVIGADLQVSFLDMKESDTTSDATHILNRYPDIDYCLAPVLNRSNGHFVNLWKRYNHYDETTGEMELQWAADSEHWAPQPFLCAYIREVMEACGYELLENQLEQTVYKDLYICHVEETSKWNEMLPGWSVGDFLEQIELLFNASFVVDNRKRTARLLLNNSYYAGMTTAHLTGVEDAYETEVEEPDREDHSQSDIYYNLPNNAYWRRACIPQAVHEQARHEDIPADFRPEAGEMARISYWFDDSSHRRYDTIYEDVLYGRSYILKSAALDFYMVDRFKALERENPEAEIALDIMPVEMAQATVHSEGDNVEGGINVTDHEVFLPVIDGTGTNSTDNEEETEESPNVSDLLEEETAQEETESSENPIFLAFFHALEVPIYFDREYPQADTYPIPFTDVYVEDVFSYPHSLVYEKTNDEGATLMLSALDGLFYGNTYDIDYKKAFKLSCHDPNLYSPNLIFEIRHRRYVCKEMEFTLDANGRKGAWTGTFYPIRMNDTQADTRWILADGKWRDAGVWLDNGRWLDE